MYAWGTLYKTEQWGSLCKAKHAVAGQAISPMFKAMYNLTSWNSICNGLELVGVATVYMLSLRTVLTDETIMLELLFRYGVWVLWFANFQKLGVTSSWCVCLYRSRYQVLNLTNGIVLVCLLMERIKWCDWKFVFILYGNIRFTGVQADFVALFRPTL